MHRFFIPPEAIHEGEVHFPPETAHQMQRVLRLRAGQRVVVLDNTGSEFEVELTLVAGEICQGKVAATQLVKTEPGVEITLYLCLTQREKFEWMLQKCTEVGASVFVPVISQRSLVQHEQEVRQKPLRWGMIVREAAEQCGRGKIPQVLPVVRLAQVFETSGGVYDAALIPWEKEAATSLRQILAGYQGNPPRRVAVLIGPEGGITDEEVQAASAAGWQPVTLGKRILRMETAAVVATALVLHELEQ